MDVSIYIEGERLDLFEDENISVTSGVQDVRDISKLFADFSQSFTVPASDNNNRIFKHWYNFDIDNGFDARTRKLSTIDVGTLDFKRGKMQLLGAKKKNGEVEHYKISFFGDTIKVKDLLGDDKLKDLSWLSNFDHSFTDVNVKIGLTTGLSFSFGGETFNKAIVYPLVSYQRQYLYDSDVSNTTSTDKLVNIAYDGVRTDGVSFTELKPGIRLSIILRAIKEKYGLQFTGNFFRQPLFDDIYVNINNTRDSFANGYLKYEELSGTQTFLDPTKDRYRYSTTITPQTGFEDVNYKVKLTVKGIVVYESQDFVTGTRTFNGSPVQFTTGYDVKAEIFTETDFQFNATTILRYTYNVFDSVTVFNNSYNNQSISLVTRLTERIKDIKVYDFLASIRKKFNIVFVPGGEDIYANDLQSWYTEGKIYDITEYVSTEEENVDKGKIYNQINFNFKTSKQILANFYKQNNAISYGDLELRLYEDSEETIPLNGSKLEIKSLFENPIFERLTDQDGNNLTSIQYCLMVDENIDPYVSEPFLFYAPSVDISSNSIGFKNATSYEELNGNIIMPSHSQQINLNSFNLNFNSVSNEYTQGEVFQDTIFKRFFKDYITDIFSVKRRLIKRKAKLPLHLLHSLKLNDRLIINGTRYIQNKITSNITNREDSLELINDIYEAPLLSDKLSTIQIGKDVAEFDNGEHRDSVDYYGDEGSPIVLIDSGDGVGWVTLETTETNKGTTPIIFFVNENASGLDRAVTVKINDPAKKKVEFYIAQYA